MKFLTLNSHSWMEENAQQKFETLKEQILEAQYDVICFQEVNQEMASETVETDEYYQALPSSVAIHKDHFVRVLVEELAAQGLHYYWTWAYNHIGYDHLNEGVAVLSRQPLKADEILVSNMDDRIRMHDYSKEQLLLLIEDYVTINFQGMKYQTREAILNMICDAVNYYDIGKDLNWESIIAIREDLEDDLKEYVDEIISIHHN